MWRFRLKYFLLQIGSFNVHSCIRIVCICIIGNVLALNGRKGENKNNEKSVIHDFLRDQYR